MQGMVAGKRSRGKPRQRREKDMYGTMAAEWQKAVINFAETYEQRRRQEVCSEKKNPSLE